MNCPMKFCNVTLSLKKSCAEESIDNFLSCDKEKCAWYCTYPNGKGECAIHSLPGLFDGLQDICKEISIK